MSTLLLLTSALQPSAEVLPGLALLGHQVQDPARPRAAPCSRRPTPTCCSSTAARSSPTPATCAG